MNKSLRITLALASGGGLGGFISSLLGGFWIVIGFLVGGVLAYLAVDLPDVKAGATTAWDETFGALHKPTPVSWSRVWTVAGATIAAYLANFSVVSWIAVYFSSYDYLGYYMGYNGWILLSCLIALPTTALVMVSRLSAKKVSLKTFSWKALVIAGVAVPPVLCLLGLVICSIILTLMAIGIVCYGAYWVIWRVFLSFRWLFRTTPKMLAFAKTTFIEIHSDLRLLCMTDACLGSALSWLAYVHYGNYVASTTGFLPARAVAIIGGAVVSVLLGLLNHELVAVRWMKLDVRPLFGEKA